MLADVEHTWWLDAESATLALAGAFARAAKPGLLIALSGELGAGKTVFARGFIRALGHAGNVKSPTFTLVETYDLACGQLHHFDLYRLQTASELYGLGFDDYLDGAAICLVEWPERGGVVLTGADLWLTLTVEPQTAPFHGRRLRAAGRAPLGTAVIQRLIDELGAG